MNNRIESALASGRWAIDWWDGDPRPDEWELPRVMFLRPAVVGMEGSRHDATWGGPCTFLDGERCAIYPSRPAGCRALVKGPYGCQLPGDAPPKQVGAISWIPYQALLDYCAEADLAQERAPWRRWLP